MPAKPYEEMTNLHEDSTYILGDLIMEGSLDGGDHPVVIDGQFKGDVTAIDFIIREKGRVTGTVKAKTVVINGQFNGNLICESLNVTATGIVDGEVQANALSIDLGAEVIGSISRVNVKSKQIACNKNPKQSDGLIIGLVFNHRAAIDSWTYGGDKEGFLSAHLIRHLHHNAALNLRKARL